MAHIPDFGIIRPPPFLAERPLARALRVFNVRHPLEAPPPQPLEVEPTRRRPRAAPAEFRRTPQRERARLLDALVDRIPAPEAEPIAPEVLQAERAQQVSEQIRLQRNVEVIFPRVAAVVYPTQAIVVTPAARRFAPEPTQATGPVARVSRRAPVRVFELWGRRLVEEEAIPEPGGRGRVVDVHA